MKLKTLCALLIVSSLAKSQEQKSNPVASIVSKKTIQFGIQSNFGFGFNTTKEVTSSFMFNPKISYFLIDRLSLGIGYAGVHSNLNSSNKPTMLHNGEVELKYFFVAKKPILFYAHAGYFFGQSPFAKMNVSPVNTHSFGSALKVGAGVSWRFKRAPNLTFNMEINEYISLRPDGKVKFQLVPDFSVGFSYFLNTHKKKKKKITPEN